MAYLSENTTYSVVLLEVYTSKCQDTSIAMYLNLSMFRYLHLNMTKIPRNIFFALVCRENVTFFYELAIFHINLYDAIDTKTCSCLEKLA